MIFNSVDFFLLLAITVALYWQSTSLFWRQNCLIVASLIFYAYWFLPYLPLFLALSGIAYIAGLAIATRESARRRNTLCLSVVLFLIVLAIFKYTQFSFDLFNRTAAAIHVSTVLPEINIRVPLGLSFICFQLIGYLVDVARQKIPPERSLRIFTLFIGFFPQLIAGPICRAEQLIPQLKQKLPFNLSSFTSGVLIVAIGLFLKVGFADGLAPFVDSVFSADSYAQAPTFLAAISFGVQIFCDFWGYSTMAVGAAKLFGIEIPINFYLPYLASSLREFWRRWHITLSDWFRDYLYIPLGGSRRGQLITVRNLLITMGLCGLWHGASLTFVFWGLLHGMYLVAERFWILGTQSVVQALRQPISKMIIKQAQLKPLLRAQPGLQIANLVLTGLGWLVTSAFLTTTWIFFRAQTLEDALRFTQAAWDISSAQWQASAMILILLAFAHIPSQQLADAFTTKRLLRIAAWMMAVTFMFSGLFFLRAEGLSAAGLEAVPNSVWIILFAFSIAHIPCQRLIDVAIKNHLHVSWHLVISGWLLILAVIMSAGESFEFIYFEF